MLQMHVKTSGSFNENASTSRILRKFANRAGKAIIESLQYVLGNEAELGYDISEEYAVRKEKDPRLIRVVGKSPNQPLILSTEIYEGFEIQYDAEGFFVVLKEEAGIDKGFDYARYFDEEFQGTGLHYTQKALDRVEDVLPGILEDVIIEEMGLA